MSYYCCFATSSYLRTHVVRIQSDTFTNRFITSFHLSAFKRIPGMDPFPVRIKEIPFHTGGVWLLNITFPNGIIGVKVEYSVYDGNDSSPAVAR